MTNGQDHDMLIKVNENVVSMCKKIDKFEQKLDSFGAKCPKAREDCVKEMISRIDKKEDKTTVRWVVGGISAFFLTVIIIIVGYLSWAGGQINVNKSDITHHLKNKTTYEMPLGPLDN